MGETAEELKPEEQAKAKLEAVPDLPEEEKKEKGPGILARLLGLVKKKEDKEASLEETQKEIATFCARFTQNLVDAKNNAGRGKEYKEQTLRALKELRREAFNVTPNFNKQYLDYLIKSLENSK